MAIHCGSAAHSAALLGRAGQMTTVLEDAIAAADGDRARDYGEPIDDFTRVALAATALELQLDNPLHHALYMVLVKISRLVQTPDHRDSVVDIAGYARTYEKCLDSLSPILCWCGDPECELAFTGYER